MFTSFWVEAANNQRNMKPVPSWAYITGKPLTPKALVLAADGVKIGGTCECLVRFHQPVWPIPTYGITKVVEPMQ